MEAVTSQWETNIRNKALQEGEEIGLQKGLQQGDRKLCSIVRSMKQKGFATPLISELTGLSEEEIRAIDP